MAKTVGLGMLECAELVRVALRAHSSPVSRIVAVAICLMRKQSPGLKAIVSYADPHHGHHGGIYQAGNWIYLGVTKHEVRFMHQGKMLQRRAYSGKNFGRGPMPIPKNAKKIIVPGKHKYVMPLDDDMRAKILPLAKPYPKRAGSAAGGTSAIHAERGGSIPTPALSDIPTGG